jgi:hypothetical protein
MWQAVIMKKYINKVIDVLGKCLLLWFVFSTCIYFYSGRFIGEIKMIPNMINWGFWDLLYLIVQIPVESIGMFIVIPLLLKGNHLGLIFGLAYWLLGYFINPLWYIVPRDLQLSPDGKATNILWLMNIIASGTYLIILVSFYVCRRSLRKESGATTYRDRDAHH